MDNPRQSGSCDSGYSCAYTNNLSWRSETQPMPPILDPRMLYERLFGMGAELSPDERRRQNLLRSSVLDFATDSTKSLMSDLGPTDRHKLDECFTAIRSIEQRLQARGQGRYADYPRHAKASRCAGGLRRALPVVDRYADHWNPGRCYAHGNVHGHNGGYVARVPGDRNP